LEISDLEKLTAAIDKYNQEKIIPLIIIDNFEKAFPHFSYRETQEKSIVLSYLKEIYAKH
jgi:hypothetical protein